MTTFILSLNQKLINMTEPDPQYAIPDSADLRQSPDVLDDLRRLKNQTDNKNEGVTRSNSDKPLSAQYIKLYSPVKVQGVISILNSTMDKGNTTLSEYEKGIIELQFYYGIRISEALRIRHTDITDIGQILIKGMKGSNSKVVYPILYKEFWLRVKRNKTNIPESYNRFYFYRLYKKIGLSQVMGKNKNNSVTHLLRYNYLINLMQNGITVDNLQQSIGHKSLKSTLHYVNKIREGKETTIRNY